MIEGIRILSQTPIFDYDYDCRYMIIGTIVGAIVVGLLIGILTWDFNLGIVCSIVGCVIGGFFGMLVTEANAVKTETGRYKYKVLIEDGVEMKEFYEKYSVIDQDGEIWVIEDKESVE